MTTIEHWLALFALGALALMGCGGDPGSDRGAASNGGADQPVSSGELPPPSASGTPGETEHPIVLQEAMWDGRTAPDPAAVACADDAECRVIEIACCDHCNGGTLASVRADHADEIAAAQRAGCGDVACTERGCAGGQPTCEQGRCAYVALFRSTVP
jgi:hypothetical protein